MLRPDQFLLAAINVRVGLRTPLYPVGAALAQEPSGQTRRADVKLDSIGMDLRSDHEGSHQFVQRVRRHAVPSGGESAAAASLILRCAGAS